MNNTILLDKYRNRFVMTLLFTVFFVMLVEIGAYIFFVSKGMYELSIKDPYLRWKVIFPVVLNWIIQIIAIIVDKSKKIRHDTKNKLVVFAALAVSFVTTAVHREYIVIMGAFMFPLIFSATFNDQKLFNQAAILSLVIVVATAYLLWKDGTTDLTTAVNIIVMFGFWVVSYFGGHISIDFSKRSFNIIHSQKLTNEHLQNIVLRDQMTGLYNHRTFYSELELSMQKANEDANKFCLAMIDIDDFKNINDSYGHDKGDAVLKNLAQIIEKHCSAEDKACRYGGEEFAVILNHKDLSQAKKQMKNILEEFVKSDYDFTDRPITFSCGVASFEKNISREDFFNIADSCMYRAKKTGKNQIVTA